MSVPALNNCGICLRGALGWRAVLGAHLVGTPRGVMECPTAQRSRGQFRVLPLLRTALCDLGKSHLAVALPLISIPYFHMLDLWVPSLWKNDGIGETLRDFLLTENVISC